MAAHHITITVELLVTDEEWEKAYGVETIEQIAEHVDAVVIDAVRTRIDGMDWGDVIRSTPRIVSSTPA